MILKRMKKIVTVFSCLTMLLGTSLTVSAAGLPGELGIDFSSTEGIEKITVPVNYGEYDLESGHVYYYDSSLKEIRDMEVYSIPVGTVISIPGVRSEMYRAYVNEENAYVWAGSNPNDDFSGVDRVYTVVPATDHRQIYEINYQPDKGTHAREFTFMAATSTSGEAVTQSNYTVVDVNAVFYTMETTAVYVDADLAAVAILPQVGQKLPVLVTGITSNGFFRVDLGTGVPYYVLGYGLTEN